MSDEGVDSPIGKAGETAGPRWDLLLAVLLWTPLAVLYLWSIDRVPFHIDEYRTLYVVRESIPTLLEDRLRKAHQPLYFLCAWLSARVLGSDSLWAMRLLPQVACFVALGFLYATVRQVVGRYAAVLAVAFCMLSSSFMWASHNARPVSFMAMFLMAATYLIVSAGEKPRVGRLLWIGGMTLLALLSYNAALMVVGAMVVGVLFVPKARWRLFVSLMVPLVLFLAWFIYTTTLYTAKERMGWLEPGSWVRWPGAVFDMSFNMDLIGTLRMGEWWTAIAVYSAWTVLIGFVIFGLTKAHRFGVLFILMWFVQLGVGLFSLVLLDINAMQIKRYFIASALFQAIGLAAAVTAFPVKAAWLRTAVCAFVLLLAGVGLLRHLQQPVPVREMDLVQYIHEHASDKTQVYVLQSSRLRYQLEYHLDREVHMMPHVFGLETSRDIVEIGVQPVTAGQPMNPMPHENAQALVIVALRNEIDSEPGKTIYAAPQAMRDKIDELVETYGEADIVELESGYVYHLHR